MQSATRNTLIASAIGIILIIAASIYFAAHRRSSNVAVETSGSASTSTATQDGVTVSGGTATVKELSNPPKAPSYTKSLSFPSTMDANAKAAIQKQFTETTAILKGDATNFQAWINLGTLRKMTGDYKGAEAAWSYVAGLYPQSTVPFDNLGELYLDFIKDYPKAEAYFKRSISLNAKDTNAYLQLFSLYTTYGYKAGTSAAADLVAQGLKADPKSKTFLQLQSQLAH